MRKIITILLILSIIILSGCVNLDNYVTVDKYRKLEDRLDNVIDDYSSLQQDYNSLKAYNYDLKKNLNTTEKDLEKYKELLNNLNDLLDNVYYGYGSNSNWTSDGFTAFSMKYKDRFYIITAGHCVHYVNDNIDTGLYTTIKIRNNNGEWIYPELLTYENDFEGNRDYAILYSDKINDGFKYNKENNYIGYVLGNIDKNILKNYNASILIDGESGSPIINLDGEVTAIATGGFQDIDMILEAIDKL